jgi:SAM-dependent methyltransferase
LESYGDNRLGLHFVWHTTGTACTEGAQVTLRVRDIARIDETETGEQAIDKRIATNYIPVVALRRPSEFSTTNGVPLYGKGYRMITPKKLIKGAFHAIGLEVTRYEPQKISVLHGGPICAAETRHQLVGPPQLWKAKRAFQIEFLRARGLEPQHFLLDIGCGTLRGGIPLIDYLGEAHYFGIETRPEVLEEGKAELQDNALESKRPILLAGTPGPFLTLDQHFDFIWAFSVLIHMNDTILMQTLEFVSRHLADNGTFYANVNIRNAEEGQWQGFPVVSRSLDFYQEQCSQFSLTADSLGPLSSLGHVVNNEAQNAQQMLAIRHFSA